MKRKKKKKMPSLLIHPCNWIRFVLVHFHHNSTRIYRHAACMKCNNKNTAEVKRLHHSLDVRNHCNGFIVHSIVEYCCNVRLVTGDGNNVVYYTRLRANDGNFIVSGKSMWQRDCCIYVSLFKLKRVEKLNLNLIS